MDFWGRPLLALCALLTLALSAALFWGEMPGMLVFIAGLLVYLAYHLYQMAALSADRKSVV